MLTRYFNNKYAARIPPSTSLNPRPRYCLLNCLFAASVSLPTWVYATQQPITQSGAETLSHDSEIIVTGVYRSQPQVLSTHTLETMSAAEVAAIAPTDTSTLLRSVRGLLVNQQGGLGGVSEVSIHGSESNFVSVFIDGVAVNDPVNSRGGSFNFNALSPAAIDRIEVLRGPNSAIYSSGALAGAIHLITLTPTEQPQGRLSVDAGEHGYNHSSIKFTSGTNDWGYGLRLASLDSGHGSIDSHYKSDDVAGLLSHQFNSDNYTQVSFRYAKDRRQSLPEQSGGPLFAQNRRLETGHSEEYNGRFLWRSHVNATWQSQLEANYFDRHSTTRSPGIFPYHAVPATSDSSDYERRQWRWTNTLGQQPLSVRRSSSKPAMWFNVGVEGEHESGNSQGFVDFGFALPTDFRLDRKNTGVFANTNLLTSQGWLWQMSLRHDNPNSANTQNVYQAGVSSPKLYDEAFQISLNWGQAYKLPSFFALAHPLVGNQQLRPEQATGWTLNLNWAASEGINTELSLFNNHYKDLIDFDAERFKNVNRSSVKNAGADFSIHWQAHHSTLITANATYTDIDVEDNASKLTGRPQWSSSLRLQHHFNHKLTGYLNYRWRDQQFATSLHTGKPVTQTLKGYGLLDINLQWKISDQFSSSIRLDNVTNTEFQEAVGFSGQQRRARIGFTFNF